MGAQVTPAEALRPS